MKLQYPPNIKIIRIPCSGSISQELLLQTFENGADGIFVAGCQIGNCHFLQGNFYSERRVSAVKNLLDEVGLDSRRLAMYYLSSSEGLRFAQIANEMTERIRQLGPNPLAIPHDEKARTILQLLKKNRPLYRRMFITHKRGR